MELLLFFLISGTCAVYGVSKSFYSWEPWYDKAMRTVGGDSYASIFTFLIWYFFYRDFACLGTAIACCLSTLAVYVPLLFLSFREGFLNLREDWCARNLAGVLSGMFSLFLVLLSLVGMVWFWVNLPVILETVRISA